MKGEVRGTSRGSPWRRRLALSGASVAAVLVLIEVLARVLHWAPATGYPPGLFVPDEAIGFRMASGYRGWMRIEGGAVEVRTNEHGYRDRPFGAKEAGAFRVLALGDSFCFGHGVRPEETYPKVVERLLDRPGRRVEVLNLGVAGYGTIHELRQLAQEGPSLDPDLVLLGLYVGNDLRDNMEFRFGRMTARSGSLVAIREGEPSWWVSVKAALAVHSHALRAAHRAFPRMALSQEEIVRRLCEEQEWAGGLSVAFLRVRWDADAERALEITVETLEAMRDLAAETLGAQLVLLLLPAPHQYDEPVWQMLAGPCAFHPSVFDLEKPQRALRSAAAKLGIPRLDPLEAFREWCREHPEEKPYLDVHPSPAGHRLLAMEVVRFLEELRLVPAE